MPNRLEPLSLMDFTGGLNLRRSSFQLSDTESPDLLNVDIDPRGGFQTRHGWQRWNDEEIVDVSAVTWEPRSSFSHVWANGSQQIYVANDTMLYSAGTTGAFTRVGTIVGSADPHCFDYAAWGDDLYIACGMASPSYHRTRDGAPTALDSDNWSEVDLPTRGVMPQADYVAAHASYLFTAVSVEVDGNHFSRVRWSHPNVPDSWRSDDFLDIDAGGGRITGLMSFRDHLLIFKTNSLWALYGYDEDSWQLIKVSTGVGCPSISAATRSETAVFFYSSSNRGGIYAYSGEAPVYLSENLRPVFEELISYQNVFVSWAGKRLWVSVPWTKGVGPTVDPTSTFVFDADIGNGAWTVYRSDYGSLGPVVDGADINAQYPLSAFWSTYVATMVTLDIVPDAYDMVLDPPSIGVIPQEGYLVTSTDAEIGVTGGETFGQGFESYYRTRWLHAGWPDRKKSWRRPTFVCREVPRDTDLIVETYRDYDETRIHRTRTLRVATGGSAYWTEGGYLDADQGGFDWKEQGAASPDGRGADWGEARAGSTLIRAGSMGLARAVQMKVRASPTTPRQRWGVDGIVAKFVPRRFR